MVKKVHEAFLHKWEMDDQMGVIGSPHMRNEPEDQENILRISDNRQMASAMAKEILEIVEDGARRVTDFEVLSTL